MLHSIKIISGNRGVTGKLGGLKMVNAHQHSIVSKKPFFRFYLLLIFFLNLFPALILKAQNFDNYWLTEYDIKGANGQVTEIVVDGNDIYFAGNFTYFAGQKANGLIKWDGISWTTFDGMAGKSVFSLAVKDGTIYVATNYFGIQRWNGTGWEVIGEVNDLTYALEITNDGLYAGGNFTTVNGISANAIAFWDGVNWSSVGTSVPGEFSGGVDDILLSDKLYVVGSFTSVGGTPANRIAAWDGTSWSSLGLGLNDYTSSILQNGNDIIVGGNFTNAGGTAANRIAVWDGTSWSTYGNGVESLVAGMCMLNGDLIVGFQEESTTAITNSLSVWKGQSWSTLGSNIDNNVFVLTEINNKLYVGGDFSEIGSITANSIAILDGQNWSTFSGLFNNGPNGVINDILINGSDVYIGGDFTKIGDDQFNNFAKWNGSGWSVIGSGLGHTVNSIIKTGNDIVVGGKEYPFASIWDGTNWSTMGSLSGSVFDITALNGEIYATGGFEKNNATGVMLKGVAKWDGSTWQPLGTFGSDYGFVLGNSITTLGNTIVVGGIFQNLSTGVFESLLQWDGSNWILISGATSALEVYGNDNILYCYGNINGTWTLSSWNGTQWSNIPGISNISNINSIDMLGGDLYVAGIFQVNDDPNTVYLAKWDGTNWYTYGSGVDGNINVVTASAEKVYIGGEFVTTGDKASLFFSMYNEDPDQDGIKHEADNCPEVANPSQTDTDADGYGLECDCDDNNVAINAASTWYQDSDNDGYGSNTVSVVQCDQPVGYVLDNTDCDDTDATISPVGTDVAGSGTDSNCDGQYIWYEDLDGDGYGTTTTVTSANATPGTGESATSNDCDDSNASIYPKIWYVDADNDGYGDATAATLTQCAQPTGYVIDNTDCDDSDATSNPVGTDVAGSGVDSNCDGQYVWYEDLDGDGYGTTTTVTSSNATPGTSESATSDDCDDTNTQLHPATVWYVDADADGYGDNNATTLTQCTQPTGHVLDNTDCDDGDATISPVGTDVVGSGVDSNCDGQYVWYEDLDGDGYGTATTVTSVNATPGTGESATSDDCDDTNTQLHPATVWYADADNDGYGDATAATVIQCTQPAGHVLDNTDCDDSDATINPVGTDVAGSGVDSNCDGQYVWYEDLDGDGYGTTTTVTSANATPGSGESATSDDCDDTNTLIHPATVWYADTDGDGYGAASAATMTQCTQPAGYVLDNTDCDDGDATRNPGGTDVAGSGVDSNCDGQYVWYEDLDGDGYGTTTTVTSANATPGTGESATSDDCDDTNAQLHSATVWYADIDNDGYGDATAAKVIQCTQPAGHVLDNTDCDDGDATISPVRTDVAGSGVDSNCDGQYVWYEDLDGDGYGTTTTVASANATPGTGESATSDDCDDTNTQLHPATVWFVDADNDGYGDNTVATLTQCAQPAGYVQDNTDCDDGDATINPGGADVAGSGVDSNCDGQYVWYEDLDGDGYGTTTTVTSANATPGAGESATSDDCDDTDSNVYPGAPSIPDGKDNNCDGTTDKILLTVTVTDVTKMYGTPNPAFVISYTGFVNGDDESVLDVLPTVSTTATGQADAGSYGIEPGGGVDDGYNFEYVFGTLTVTPATASITITGLEHNYDGSQKTPVVNTDPSGLNYIITYNGSTNPPVTPGTYEVLVTMDETNYTGSATATLVINEVLGLDGLQDMGLQVYPNPVNAELNLRWDRSAGREVYLYDGTGRQVLNQRSEGIAVSFDVRSLSEGLYRLVIVEGQKSWGMNVMVGGR
ncbi:MAG: MopE-related protein [Cyclobacteriaceae bacterium]|nr:MopE-related protein [Cyclobacteriaceae bacterium]